jgi:hypothetical protein
VSEVLHLNHVRLGSSIALPVLLGLTIHTVLNGGLYTFLLILHCTIRFVQSARRGSWNTVVPTQNSISGSPSSVSLAVATGMYSQLSFLISYSVWFRFTMFIVIVSWNLQLLLHLKFPEYACSPTTCSYALQESTLMVTTIRMTACNSSSSTSRTTISSASNSSLVLLTFVVKGSLSSLSKMVLSH